LTLRAEALRAAENDAPFEARRAAAQGAPGCKNGLTNAGCQKKPTSLLGCGDMNPAMILLILVHILCAVIWVGGMVFAHFMLRPAALSLEPPVRLSLFLRVLERFFPTVWVTVVLILATGFAMIVMGFGGFAAAPLYVDIMMALGIVMMLAFGHLFFGPWRRMRGALDRGDFADGGAALNQIRMIVTFNLYLGLIVIGVAATGRYWGLS
jgi:uncharacterized membrane protein